MSATWLQGYLLLFLTALGLGLLLVPLARKLALRIDLVDHPGERKIHARVMPYGGGIALVTTVFSVIGLTALVWRMEWIAQLWPALEATLAEHRGGFLDAGTWQRLGAIFVGSIGMFALGLVDDRRGLSPGIKFLAQIGAAVLLWAAGIRITCFVDHAAVSLCLTVLWVTAVTNAFNFLDNMDGLSSGVAAVATVFFFVVAVQGGELFIAAFLSVFAGALLGFLRYNFSPAKLFLGDAGSLFIGFLLSSLTVAGTYYEGRGSVYSVLMPVLVLGVPLFDTASVMLIRIKNRKPVYKGDTNHVSHRLVRLGLSRAEAVLTIYLLGIVLGTAAVLLGQLDEWGALLVFCMALGVIGLIVVFECAAIRKARESGSSDSLAATATMAGQETGGIDANANGTR